MGDVGSTQGTGMIVVGDKVVSTNEEEDWICLSPKKLYKDMVKKQESIGDESVCSTVTWLLVDGDSEYDNVFEEEEVEVSFGMMNEQQEQVQHPERNKTFFF